jgi:hypothetical protein
MVLLDVSMENQEMRLVSSLDVYKNYAGFGANSLSVIIAPIIVSYSIYGEFFGSTAVVGAAFDYQFTALITLVFF